MENDATPVTESDRVVAKRAASKFSPSGILDKDDYEVVALFALWRYPDAPQRNAVARRAILRALRDNSGVSAWAYEHGVRFQPVHWPDPGTQDWEKLEGMADPSESVEDLAVEKDMAGALWAEVDKLKDSQYNGIQTRQADVLRSIYRDGETIAGAGRIVGLSKQGACAAQLRGLERLRESIAVRRLAAQEVS